MTLRVAHSLAQLQDELDERWPSRPKPDGWIGDPAHASRSSDHNPIRVGSDDVVCAIDVHGVDIGRAVWNLLLTLRDPRLKYMIFDSRIVSSTVSPWQVRAYGGINKHRTHIHISVGRGPSGASTRPDLFDNTGRWFTRTSTPRPTPDPGVDDMNSTQDRMLRELHGLLTSAVGKGQTSLTGTLTSTHKHGVEVLRKVREVPDGHAMFLHVYNALAQYHGKNSSPLDVDEVVDRITAELKNDLPAMLTHLTTVDIAEAVIDGLDDEVAVQVVNELAERLHIE